MGALNSFDDYLERLLSWNDLREDQEKDYRRGERRRADYVIDVTNERCCEMEWRERHLREWRSNHE